MRSSSLGIALITSLLAAAPALAAKGKKAAPPPPDEAMEPPPAAAQTPEESEAQRALKSIKWTAGPAKVGIAEHGEIQIPEGFAYTGATGAQKMLELMQNPTSGNELGMITDESGDVTMIFRFQDIGYVKDADKEKLDADDILDSIKEGTEQSNEVRKQRGWPTITITGWHTKPFYNQETNNLEWCIKGESEGHPIINYNTRILGRMGVMSANLMVEPDKLDAKLPIVKKLLGGYNFVEGKRYSQYVTGDKIAKYGLTALVVGGAAGIAAKTGLLAKLAVMFGKAWKLLIVGLIAVGAGIKKLFSSLGRRQPPPPGAAPPPATG